MDPSAFGTFNLGNIMAQAEQVRTMQANRAQAEQKAQKQRRLGELLPQVLNGGIGGGLPRPEAMDELAGLDPELFMKLDDRQREQAKAEASEIVSAVQWADTPEKWAQAQQYLGSKGMDVSGYGFEQREQYLLQAGKIGELLENRPKPSAQPSSVQEYEFAKQQGFGGSYMDFMEEKRGPMIASNGDGTFTVIPRGTGAGQAAPSAAPPPPPPGFVVDGGPTQPASGGFPG